VWIYKDNRPVIKVTGSHKHLCLFGAVVGLNGKLLFREYNRFNENNFYKYLKQYTTNFQNVICLWIKLHNITNHKKLDSIYFEKHKDVLIPVWLPTASPEFMVLE
jgi:hypothetical protein